MSVCEALHERANSLQAFRFPFDEGRIPINGIYILFEKGETAHGTNRLYGSGPIPETSSFGLASASISLSRTRTAASSAKTSGVHSCIVITTRFCRCGNSIAHRGP
jgi:hypothetical protein